LRRHPICLEIAVGEVRPRGEHSHRSGGGATEHRERRECAQAIAAERDEDQHAECRRGDPPATRGQVERGTQRRGAADRERARECRARVQRSPHEERKREPNEDAEAVPVVERIAQVASPARKEARHAAVADGLGEKPAREREQPDPHDSQRQPVGPASAAASVRGQDDQREDGQVQGRPVDLGERALRAVRPRDPDRGPREQRGEHTSANERGARRPLQRPHERGDRHSDPPPRRDCNGIADGDVVSATLEAHGEDRDGDPYDKAVAAQRGG
jgi:hypothetical protein